MNVTYISIDSNYEDTLVCEILDRFAFYSSDSKQYVHPGYLNTIKPIRKQLLDSKFNRSVKETASKLNSGMLWALILLMLLNLIFIRGALNNLL